MGEGMREEGGRRGKEGKGGGGGEGRGFGFEKFFPNFLFMVLIGRMFKNEKRMITRIIVEENLSRI